MSRRRLSEVEVIAVLIQQGVIIPCFRCNVPFRPSDILEKRIQREHLFELALGGPDTIDNMRFSHRECHAEITDGTKATTAGSSKNRIAKAKRQEAKRLGTARPKHRKKIPARADPWNKRLRKLNEAREQ